MFALSENPNEIKIELAGDTWEQVFFKYLKQVCSSTVCPFTLHLVIVDWLVHL